MKQVQLNTLNIRSETFFLNIAPSQGPALNAIFIVFAEMVFHLSGTDIQIQ